MTRWILLRGLTREARHWGGFLPLLRAALPGCSVAALDLPGNGWLCRMRSPARIQDMTEHCRRAAAAQGLAPPYNLLALSLGAMTAADWATRHAHEVAGCVLINTSLRSLGPLHWRLRPQSYPALLGMMLRPRDALRQEAAILRLTSRDGAARPATLEAWTHYSRECPVSRANALRQLLAAARFRMPQHRPSAPVLVLAGAGDRLVDPRCSRRLAERWQARLAVHPDAGHDLPLDDPEWVVARVQDWLGSRC